MALRIKSSQDFWTGCAFTAFGAGTVILAQAHPLGSAARMGSGYFPTALGVILAGIGLIIVLKSLVSESGGGVGRIDVLLLVRVLLAVAAFAFLLHPLGLVLSAFIVVVLAAHAGHEFRLGEALASAVVLALVSYLLFVRALNQTLPVWPWFLAT
jgi:putative tricarboxylic transport membrane protein